MRTFFLLLFLLTSYQLLIAQVGINSPDLNEFSVLDIVSNQKGILIPRLTTTERNENIENNDPSTTPPVNLQSG